MADPYPEWPIYKDVTYTATSSGTGLVYGINLGEDVTNLRVSLGDTPLYCDTRSGAHGVMYVGGVSVAAGQPVTLRIHGGNTAGGAPSTADQQATYPASWQVFYPCEEASSPVADRTANERNGTVTGGVTFGVDTILGKALSFDGSSGQIAVGADVITVGTTAFTVDCWFLLPAAGNGNYDTIYAIGTENGNYGLHAYYGGSRQLFWDRAGVSAEVPGGTTYSLGYLHHVAFVYSRPKAQLFLDGVADSADTTINNASGADGNDFVGVFSSAYRFKGVLQRLCVSTAAASAAEIKEKYVGSLPGAWSGNWAAKSAGGGTVLVPVPRGRRIR